MYARTLLAALMLGVVAAPGLPAHAEGRAQEAIPDAGEDDARRLREAGEQACGEVLDAAALLGERLEEVGQQMSRLMARAGDQLVREMTPAMRGLAGRLDEMARELEQRSKEREGT